MAVIEPYSPCPCGSGQKFKWCCHKVEAYAERSQRLFEAGQLDAALQALDEGLKKEATNAWLLTRKALLLIKQGKAEGSKECLEVVLKTQPKHFGALVLMTRLALEIEGPAAGVDQLQKTLAAFPPAERKKLASLPKLVGSFLVEGGFHVSALKHMALAQELAGEGQGASEARTADLIRANPNVSPWLKNEDALGAAPEGATGEAVARFNEALAWAAEGLWSAAAAAFDVLVSDPDVGLKAERNLGLCRLWLADHEAGAGALRRYAEALGPTAEAVDVEGLCQHVSSRRPDVMVEHVQLTWPIRNREALIGLLENEPTVSPQGTGEVDPDDPESVEVEEFAILDRANPFRDAPPAEGGAGLSTGDVPVVLGSLLVGPEFLVLEAFDDGRLDSLMDRVAAMTGPAIVPAHPRTKVLGKTSRLQLKLAWEWIIPDGVLPEQALRLTREKGTEIIETVWPDVPLSALEGLTPRQAAAREDFEVPLRAALMQLENSNDPWRVGFDFGAFREKLGVAPEPPLDAVTVDPSTVHLSRLHMLPADRLTDEKLAALYLRAKEVMSRAPLQAAAMALVGRPEVLAKLGIASLDVYSDLATIASADSRPEEALEWARRGRLADPPAARAAFAPQWDMIELRIRARHETPESWVPDLAVVLDRYAENSEATQVLMVHLLDMGLVSMQPNPDRRGEMFFDPRPLQVLLSRFGPRVTTSTGRLGVSAAKPDIWTPAGPAGGGGGGLWTPGSAGGPSSEGGEKKLILPGR